MDYTGKNVRITFGCFKGHVGECLCKSISETGWVVKFPESVFAFTYSEKAMEVVE